MIETLQDIGWSVIFSLAGGLIGVILVIGSSLVLPVLISRMTPNIDEQKELIRGNAAVGEYYGRVAGSAILGLSIVVAAAVLGGIIAALH
jgi:ABC-type antimicrobial peptide transport system permease subunit